MSGTTESAAASAAGEPWWTQEIEALLATRAEPCHPVLLETQRLIELVFGSPAADPARPPGLAPRERAAAIEYYVSRSVRLATDD